VELGANVMAAYLPQNITFKNEELTVLECFREDISILEGKAREYLSKFMFYKSSVFKKVKQLSGGERIRLKLGMLLYQDINLLILDEPSNHLDIDSIETLEEALEDFKGTIFFISHDRYFINKMGERVIAVEKYAFKSYLGNYDYYKSEKEKVILQEVKEPVEKNKKIKPQKNNHDGKNQEAVLAKALAKIEILEKEINEIDLAMSTGQIDYDELNSLYCRKQELCKELDTVMEFWLSCNN
jgi:ABC-type multidrug transport system ATPase subunit